MLIRYAIPILTLASTFLPVSEASACPGCSASSRQPFSVELKYADYMLLGTLDAVADPSGEYGKGNTDLTITMVVKGHDSIKDKKVLRIPRYLPPESKKTQYLLFFTVLNGQPDPYRWVKITADSKLAEYLKGVIAVREKDITARLRFYFDYLESPELDISEDAYSEFSFAEYREVRPVAAQVSPETLRTWLADPNLTRSRYGLYGLLLGHCGKPADAKVLRDLLDDPARAFTSGRDGVLGGYIMLNPTEGWDYLLNLIRDPKKLFESRYAGLHTIRFLKDCRPDVISADKLAEGMKILIEAPDISDMMIDDLRKWRQWDMTPTILALIGKPDFNGPLIKRSVLKFAVMAAPHDAAAAEFVKQARLTDPNRVKLAEDLLKDEMKVAASAAAASSKVQQP